MQWPRVDVDLAPVLCAVIGAVATRHYMPERRTGDINIAIQRLDVDTAHERLKASGYQPLGDVAIGRSTWRKNYGQEVDLIEGEEPWWSEAIRQAQENRDLQGLPTLPLPCLVLMKLRASRAQDLADVSRMMGQADERATKETLGLVQVHAPKDVPDLQSLIDLGRLEWQQP